MTSSKLPSKSQLKETHPQSNLVHVVLHLLKSPGQNEHISSTNRWWSSGCPFGFLDHPQKRYLDPQTTDKQGIQPIILRATNSCWHVEGPGTLKKHSENQATHHLKWVPRPWISIRIGASLGWCKVLFSQDPSMFLVSKMNS